MPDNVNSTANTATAPQGVQPPKVADNNQNPVGEPKKFELPSEIASLIPERFQGDIGKLAKSYGELEKKLREKSSPAPNPNDPNAPKIGSLAQKELYETGDLSENTRNNLKALGFDDDYINSQKEFYNYKVQKISEDMTKGTGIEAKKILDFVKDKAAKGEYSQNKVNMLQIAIVEKDWGAFTSVKNDMNNVSSLPAAQRGSTAVNSGGFQSAKEFQQALADKRYKQGDQQFIKEVQNKFEATPDEIRAKFMSA